ncbi:hypothetical protein SK128_023373, partial [Halocaridina rubra]
AMSLPCLLQQFLTGVLTGELENESPSKRVELLIQFPGQDLIYATTRERHKLPKYFALPYAIRALT